MTVLDTLNFVAFNPHANNNPIAVLQRYNQYLSKASVIIPTRNKLFFY